MMETETRNEKFFTTPLILIFVTVFIDLVGFGIVIPILPFYANSEPFFANPFEIGMLVAVYSWMQFFFAPILGRLSDKYGRRPILFFSLFGAAVGYFVLGLANTLLLVFIGRIIAGITGGNIGTAQAYIADVTTRENRAKGMGLFGAAFGLGFILGPAIAGILSKYGVNVPFYFAGFLSLANAVAVYFILPESIKPGEKAEEHESRWNKFTRSFRDRRFAIINLIYFLLITAFSIMTYAYVLYTAYRFDYTPEQNGYLFAYVGFVSIIGQGVLFGYFAKKFGEPRLTVAGSIIMAASLLSIPFIGPQSGGLTALLIMSAFLSLGNAFSTPSLNSLASKISHESEQGRSLGIMQSGASLARAIGPTIGGILLNNAVNKIDDASLFRTFATAAAIMFVAFLTAIYFVKMETGKL